MTIVEVPDPSLVVLIGAAGSGKTTFAARHFGNDEVLSSDALRAAVAGDEADQRASGLAFRILHRELAKRLAAGRLTVIDATNTRPEHRRPLLARARAAGVPTVAIVFDLAGDVVHARNAAREGRVVDREVVDRQLAWVRGTVERGQLSREGFDRVVILDSPRAVDDLLQARRGPAPPRGPVLEP